MTGREGSVREGTWGEIWSITSDKLGHRSSGFFSSMRSTVDESSTGHSGRSSAIGWAASYTCACMTASVGPVNGGSPVNI